MTLANSIIDLRSDTVTKPTPEMLKAMSDAELGDDFFREDPTVRLLEETAAEILGLEEAMLVLSGTMGNLVSVLAQSRRGDGYIVEETAHIHIHESGWPAGIAGLSARPLRGQSGLISTAQLEEAIMQSRGRLHPPLGLMCLENTHNAAGGRVMSPAQTRELAALAHAHGMRVHLDGARLFNAAVALGLPASDFAAPADSVTFCLSKGLCCPAGAIVAGNADVIAEARRWRQVIGGGMRQAGIIAAAGLVALRSMVTRLAEDHRNAKAFALELIDAGLRIDPDAVETNMVFVELPGEQLDPIVFHAMLAEAGVVVNPPKNGRVRIVTHRGVSQSDVLDAASRFIEAYRLAGARGPARGRAATAPQAAVY